MSSFEDRKKSFEKNLHTMKSFNLKLMQRRINILLNGYQPFWNLKKNKKISIFKKS